MTTRQEFIDHIVSYIRDHPNYEKWGRHQAVIATVTLFLDDEGAARDLQRQWPEYMRSPTLDEPLDAAPAEGWSPEVLAWANDLSRQTQDYIGRAIARSFEREAQASVALDGDTQYIYPEGTEAYIASLEEDDQ